MRRAPLLALLVAACATQPEFGREGETLPNAALGPFRDVRTEELGQSHTSPNVVDDDKLFTRDPAVLDDDGDPATLPATGYFGESPDALGPTTRLARRLAADGRSFDRQGDVVLEATEAWEGGHVGAPSALRVDGELLLFYEAAGGIALARGDALAKVGLVLEPDADGLPRSPSVVRLDDGTLRMFYEVSGAAPPAAGGVADGARIFEASSDDGETWERLGEILAPGAAGAFDERAVGTPHAVVGESALGRRALHVYYGALDAQGAGAIGLASRFVGPDADPADPRALQRAAGPVFGTQKARHAREPAVLFHPGFTLLFVTQDVSLTSQDPAVACGVGPANAVLPPPSP